MNYSKIFEHLKAIYTDLMGSSRLYMDAYESYDDIPMERRRFQDLAYWMSKNDRSIEQIPEHARTDRLVFFHLYIKPHRFESITPSSRRYYAICEFALWRTCEVLSFIPVVFITEPLAKRLTLGGSRHSPLDSYANKRQFDHLYTDELIDLTLQRSLSFLLSLGKRGLSSKASVDTINSRLREAPHEFEFVIRFGMKDHLKNLMKSGFWFDEGPSSNPLGSMQFRENPQNPGAVLHQWDEASRNWNFTTFRDNEQIFAIKMDCFEDSDVVPELVKTSIGRRFLQHFYPDSRVRPFFESNRTVRGYILEQELAV